MRAPSPSLSLPVRPRWSPLLVAPLLCGLALGAGAWVGGCGGGDEEPAEVHGERPPPPPPGGPGQGPPPPGGVTSPRPLDTAITMASPAAEACSHHDSFTVLMDGDRAVDPAFVAAGSQPAALIAVTEPDGERGVLLEDFGDFRPALEANLDLTLQRVQGHGPTAHTAVLVSHPHTVGRMLLPGKAPPPPASGPDVVTTVVQRLSSPAIQGPNLDDLCTIARAETQWQVTPVCEQTFTDLPVGSTPLRWEDGSTSDRIWILTYAISPPEIGEIPFQPLESVLVVSVPPGYLVYAVCSHHIHDPTGTQHSPFHAAYHVQKAMDEGQLPRGPIHTLVTGSCGILRTYHMDGGTTAHGQFDEEGFKRRIGVMQRELGIERLFLTHCGVSPGLRHAWPHFHAALGEKVRLAFPGTCIPLDAPPGDAAP